MKNLVFVLAAIFFSSCFSDHQPENMSFDNIESEALIADHGVAAVRSKGSVNPATINDRAVPASSSATAANNQVDKTQKIIKDGHLTIEVDDLEKSKSSIEDLFKGLDAYYENESYSSYNNVSTYNLKIRVPSNNFEQLVLMVESGNGIVRNKNISARDVTEEFIDLTTRLDNNKAYLSRYRDLLKQANTIKDILQIEEKIRRIEEEIESRQGRLNYLNDQVGFSNLNLTLTHTAPRTYDKPRHNFINRLTNAFSNGISWFLDLLIGIVQIWPIILIGIGLILFRRRLWAFIKR